MKKREVGIKALEGVGVCIGGGWRIGQEGED